MSPADADQAPNADAVAPPTSLVVVAAGAGSRMRADTRKPYLPLRGQPVLFHTLARFRDLDFIRERFVVVAPQDVAAVERQWPALFHEYGVDAVIAGGQERVHSVECGVARCGTYDSAAAVVAIHDGVRPFVETALVAAACREAARVGGAILAAPVADTLKRAADAAGSADDPSVIAETVPRADLWAAQTPQVFRVELLREAYAAWHAAGAPAVTDDAALMERIGGRVALIPSPRTNLKLTTPDDLVFAEFLLSRQPAP